MPGQFDIPIAANRAVSQNQGNPEGLQEALRGLGFRPSGGGLGNNQLPAQSQVDQILAQLDPGASPEQRELIAQITEQLGSQGADQLNEISQRQMANVSANAASRGLGASSIGMGGITAIGRRTTDAMARLRAGLNTQAMQQLLQLPFQRAGVAANLFGSQTGLAGQELNAEAQVKAARQRAKGDIFGNMFSIL